MPVISDQKPPRVFSDLKLWLQKYYTTLPKRLQSVAFYVLHNPEIVALNTIAVISKKTNFTPSTMVRFAKSIGYQGFSDMQEVFQESMHHIPQPYSQRIHHLDNMENEEQTVLSRFGQAARQSLERMEQQLDQDNMLKACKLLANSRTIFIAGQGRATPVTTYLHYNFIKMGIQAVILSGLGQTIADKSRLIRPDEVLLAISFSPYTANTRELVEICLAQDVPVVALTDSTLSPIARNDDLHLEVLEEEVGGIRGLSATMCLALCLTVETSKYRNSNDLDKQHGIFYNQPME